MTENEMSYGDHLRENLIRIILLDTIGLGYCYFHPVPFSLVDGYGRISVILQ